MSQGLPQLKPGVFSASASIVVDAPRDVVWQVLMDWPAYHEWNPFTRKLCLTDSSKRPLSDSEQTPRAGAYLNIQAHIPPSFDPPSLLPASSALEFITTLDTENYRCAWENVQFPSWMMTTERWQALVEVDGNKTRYETVLVFRGPLAYVTKAAVGHGLERGLVAMAEGLKTRCEALSS